MAPSLSLLQARSNDALKLNPPVGNPDIHITTHGSDWLWAVTAVDFLAIIAFLVLLYLKPRTDRIFHYITVLIVVVSGYCYFTLASDIGSTAAPPEWPRGQGPTPLPRERQIFWIRYVDWLVKCPHSCLPSYHKKGLLIIMTSTGSSHIH